MKRSPGNGVSYLARAASGWVLTSMLFDVFNCVGHSCTLEAPTYPHARAGVCVCVTLGVTGIPLNWCCFCCVFFSEGGASSPSSFGTPNRRSCSEHNDSIGPPSFRLFPGSLGEVKC